jgi:hypothetical protein
MAAQSSMNRSELMKGARARGLVNTPGGFRRPLFVHLVEPHHIIVRRGGVSHLIDKNTGALVEKPAAEAVGKDPADQAGGWSTWATWNNQTGQPIRSIVTSWTVPAPPNSQSGQLIYLFNGLQDPAGAEILQPVLQWGTSGAGGGDFWSVASWHVDSKHQAFCTPSVRVNPGDQVTGVMTQVASFADGTHNYQCEFQGIAGTSLMALGLTALTAAEQTLEAYGVSSLDQYPAAPATKMTQIGVELTSGPAQVNWAANTMANPLFGEHTDIVSNANPGGEVDLFY